MDSKVLEAIRAAGGEAIAVTSEPQALATEAEQDWEIEMPAIGDPHHEIREVLKERGLLDVFYNEDYGHLRERKWASHPKGYYQPAVIALSKTGRVLYRWRCVPKYSNMSGAGARPEARYTWEQIQAARKTNVDAPIDTTPTFSGVNFSWPANLLAMTAHGWFVRPKAFPLGRDGDDPSISLDKIFTVVRRRTIGFIAAWIIALFVLPLYMVGAAAVVWLIVLIPGLIEIHRQFQNEPDAS